MKREARRLFCSRSAVYTARCYNRGLPPPPSPAPPSIPAFVFHRTMSSAPVELSEFHRSMLTRALALSTMEGAEQEVPLHTIAMFCPGNCF